MKKRVKLLVNIGQADQRQYKLSESQQGKTIEVDEGVAATLIKKNWAAEVSQPAAAKAKEPDRTVPSRDAGGPKTGRE